MHLEDLYDAFAEGRLYPAMHVFFPALIYIYIYLFKIQSKIFVYYTLIFGFEVIEYVMLAVFYEKEMHETIPDAIISDVLMATLGLWSAIVFTSQPYFTTRFIPTEDNRDLICCFVSKNNRPKKCTCQIDSCNVNVLYATSLLNIGIQILYFFVDTGDNVELDFLFYAVVYVSTSLIFINIEWALFSAFCFFFISIGATDVYQRDFMYVPLVNLVVVPAMTILAYLWYKNKYCTSILSCWKNKDETWTERTIRFKTTPSPLKENEWRYAQC